MQQNYEINKTFRRIATTKCDADVEHLDFQQPNESARIINEIVEMKTNKTVRNLISPDANDKQTKMILVNTLQFDNNWLFPIDEECTQYDNFYFKENETVQVAYMCFLFPRNVLYSPLHGYAYLHDLQATAIELYFGHTSFAVTIIMLS